MQIGSTAEALSTTGGVNGEEAVQTEGGAPEEGSFLKAVASAMNQHGEQPASEEEASLEVEIASLEGEALEGDVEVVDLLAQLAQLEQTASDSNGMPAMSFGNPEMAALQNKMLGETASENLDVALVTSESDDWLQGNAPMTSTTEGATSQVLSTSNLAVDAVMTTETPVGALTTGVTTGVTTGLTDGLATGATAASQTAMQNASVQGFPQFTEAAAPIQTAAVVSSAANAALTEADLVILSEQAVESTQATETKTTGMSDSMRSALSTGSGAAATREAATNQSAKAAAQNAARQAAMVTKQAHAQSSESNSGGDNSQGGSTGTEGGDAGTANSGPGGGTTGPVGQSFQASLQAQAAGKGTVSATNPEGTNIQQSAFAKMPGIPEGARLRVLSTNPTTQIARVEVQHPSLGPIQLEVQMQEQELSLKAITNSMTAAAAIGASEHALRNSINEQGMDLSEMSVNVDRGDADSSAGNEQWAEQEKRAEMVRNSRTERERHGGPDFADLTASRLNVEA